MSVTPIRLLGDPVLRTPAAPVVDFDAELRQLVADLTDTMHAAGGAGIAAPQIGVGLRVFTWLVDGEVGHLVNPEVTPSTVRRTICVQGYSARVRPPRQVTDKEKRLSARAYGYTGSFATAKLDHLVPLGIGGDPNDPRNLWLKPNEDPRATTNANPKDDVEDALHDAVCDGRVGLVEAQRAIAADWGTALAVLGLQ